MRKHFGLTRYLADTGTMLSRVSLDSRNEKNDLHSPVMEHTIRNRWEKWNPREHE